MRPDRSHRSEVDLEERQVSAVTDRDLLSDCVGLVSHRQRRLASTFAVTLHGSRRVRTPSNRVVVPSTSRLN